MSCLINYAIVINDVILIKIIKQKCRFRVLKVEKFNARFAANEVPWLWYYVCGIKTHQDSTLFFALSLVPDANDFTFISDSTSYFIPLPLNEVCFPQVTLREFTIYVSPNELNGKNPQNNFTFSLDGPGGAVNAFGLKTAVVNISTSDTVVSVPNALVTTSDESGLDFGVYILTLSVASSVHMVFYPIVNFTVNIDQGEFLFNNIHDTTYYTICYYFISFSSCAYTCSTDFCIKCRVISCTFKVNMWSSKNLSHGLLCMHIVPLLMWGH